METSIQKQLPESNNLIQVESAENMLNEELETLIMASIQTLKRSNKKCGKDEVFELVNNSLEKEISREIFESLLYRLTEKQSVKLNILGKRTCLSLPKESQFNKECNQIFHTESKEDKEYHRDTINETEVTERKNAIENDSSKGLYIKYVGGGAGGVLWRS